MGRRWDMVKRYYGFGPNHDEIEERHNGGPLPANNGDWIVMPYRLAEACRISLHSISMHPDLPPQIQWWISQWLNGYNALLSRYFEENYGPDIFDTLTRITLEVRTKGEETAEYHAETALNDFFNRWEDQMKGNDEQA